MTAEHKIETNNDVDKNFFQTATDILQSNLSLVCNLDSQKKEFLNILDCRTNVQAKNKLQPGISNTLYFSLDGFFDSANGEGLTLNNLIESNRSQDDIEMHPPSQLSGAEEERLNQIFEKATLYDTEKQLTTPRPPSKTQRRRLAKKEREKTAGPAWFNLSAPEMTDEFKQDLKVLNLRNYITPKDIYKKPPIENPKYLEVGTVIESSADFYSSRIPKRQRVKHFVDELLRDQEYKKYAKRKYREIMERNHAAARKKYKRPLFSAQIFPDRRALLARTCLSSSSVYKEWKRTR
jgi:hypothetical protein